MRAIIVGGSVAGLFSALALRQRGWRVSVYERARAELTARGAGIVTYPALVDLMRQAGITWRGELGVRVLGRRVFAPNGALLLERDMPQILSSWARLYQILRLSLPGEFYHVGEALAEFTVASDTVSAEFSGGTRDTGDLLVAADGIHSAVRTQLWPSQNPEYVGYVAWRGTVSERELSRTTRAALMEHFSFCLPPGEQMLGYPIADAARPDDQKARLYNFVWYRPAEVRSELPRLLTDCEGQRRSNSISPERIHPLIISELRAQADRLLAAPFAEVVQKTRAPFLQPIFDLASEHIIQDRIALVGDAAFVARPHVGMGVYKAALDATALGVAVETHPHDLNAALRLFASQQLRLGTAIVRRGRALGAYMEAQNREVADSTAPKRFRTPESVIGETAIELSAAKLLESL